MKEMDIVVIGGSAAGFTAALAARKHYPEKKILLIRKETLVPIPCGIPYIFGTVGSPQNNLIPDTPLQQNNIEIVLDEVVEVDREKQQLTTKSGSKIGYDKLVLCTGSLPMMPPIPGLDKENVFPEYNDIENLQKIQDTLKVSKKVLVIGGGFIDVEVSDETNKLDNLEVTVCELLPKSYISLKMPQNLRYFHYLERKPG